MVNYMTPLWRKLDLDTGVFTDAVLVQQRRLSDLRGLYADAAAEAARAAENPLMYDVFEATENPIEAGQLRYSTTVIYPGKIGDEYFFTKGHYHAKGECAEIYTGITGTGLLLMQTREGEIHTIEMTRGVAAYVPPFWAHRTINVGSDNFAFYACYPADAGYDYAAIADKGFASLVLERNGKPTLVPNPKWAK
jgi:glucose-6-phosphate isomerase